MSALHKKMLEKIDNLQKQVNKLRRDNRNYKKQLEKYEEELLLKTCECDSKDKLLAITQELLLKKK